jgi:hypothetical protein
MNATAGEEMPERWDIADEVHLEVYARVTEIIRLADYNALMFFAHQLLVDGTDKHFDVSDEHAIALDNFLDQCVEVDRIIRTNLGNTYITDYLDAMEDTDE